MLRRPARRLPAPAAILLASVLALQAGCDGGEPAPPSGSAPPPPPAAERAPSAAAEPEGAEPAEQGRLRVVLRAAEDGTPLPGLPVYVWPRPGVEGPERPLTGAEAELGEIPLTGADGAALFRLPPGRYSVAAEWPPADALAVEVAAGGEEALDLRRPSLPDLAVDLRVVGGEGEPLAASVIELQGLPAELAARGASSASQAGPDGRHALKVPSWLPTVAVVRAPGYSEVHLALAAGAADAPGEVHLERSARVRGRLLDAAGAPVPDAPVSARADAWELFQDGREPPLGTRTGEVAWTARTDAAGAFDLAGLPANVALTLAAERAEGGPRPARTREPLRLAPGEEREADVVLSGGTRIEGVLLGADGAPQEGTQIWLVHGGGRRVFTSYEAVTEHAVTDAAGRFTFEDVAPGSWRVGPALPAAGDGGAALAPWPEIVEVFEGMTAAELVLRPPGALTVEGRCVGPHGEEVSGVHLVAEGGEQTATAISDGNGAFELGPFVEGALQIRTTAVGAGYAAGAAQTVQAGDRDVLVHVQRAGALHGSATRASSGSPLPAEVELALRDQPEGTGVRRVTAGADGAFEVTDLEPGLFAVVARFEAENLVAVWSGAIVAPETTTELALELAVGARARFAVPPETGATFYVVLQGGVPLERGALAGGTETESRLFPPGEIAIELHGPQGLVARRTATTSAGQSVKLDFVR